jgi:hypothetical protein
MQVGRWGSIKKLAAAADGSVWLSYKRGLLEHYSEGGRLLWSSSSSGSSSSANSAAAGGSFKPAGARLGHDEPCHDHAFRALAAVECQAVRPKGVHAQPMLLKAHIDIHTCCCRCCRCCQSGAAIAATTSAAAAAAAAAAQASPRSLPWAAASGWATSKGGSGCWTAAAAHCCAHGPRMCSLCAALQQEATWCTV